MALYKYPQHHAQLLFLVNPLHQSGLLSQVRQIIGLPIQLTLLTPSTLILLSHTPLPQAMPWTEQSPPSLLSRGH